MLKLGLIRTSEFLCLWQWFRVLRNTIFTTWLGLLSFYAWYFTFGISLKIFYLFFNNSDINILAHNFSAVLRYVNKELQEKGRQTIWKSSLTSTHLILSVNSRNSDRIGEKIEVTCPHCFREREVWQKSALMQMIWKLALAFHVFYIYIERRNWIQRGRSSNFTSR